MLGVSRIVFPSTGLWVASSVCAGCEVRQTGGGSINEQINEGGAVGGEHRSGILPAGPDPQRVPSPPRVRPRLPDKQVQKAMCQ